MMFTPGYHPARILPDVASLQAGDYEEALQEFLRQFTAQYGGRPACYQFGAIRTPGVSDIDLLIVTPDASWRDAREAARRIIAANERLDYVFTHEPVVVCESLLPGLPCFHTLENCRRIAGDWDPLPAGAPPLSEGAHLLRHTVWSTFMRVGALELGKPELGLRRVLILLHNLLASAKSAAQLASRPQPIPLDTELVRARILAAPPAQQPALCHEFIEQTLATLDSMDDLLDAELAAKFGFSRDSPVVNLKSCTLATRPVPAGPVGEVPAVRVAAYSLLLVGALAQNMGAGFKPLAPFRRLPGTAALASRLEMNDYVASLTTALRICAAHEVKFFFPTPFQIGYRPRIGWWQRLACWPAALRRTRLPS